MENHRVSPPLAISTLQLHEVLQEKRKREVSSVFCGPDPHIAASRAGGLYLTQAIAQLAIGLKSGGSTSRQCTIVCIKAGLPG